MQVTQSYDNPAVVPPDVRARYVWLETSNAAAVLQATSPTEYADLVTVLRDFTLHSDDWLVAGGNKGDVPEQLDARFRAFGWKETRIDTSIVGIFRTDFVKRGNAYEPTVSQNVPTVYSEGFRVDNHKGRMIVDIEWNAKDGNLDRDFSAYRSWHEFGLINGAAIITKDRKPLLDLARRVWTDYQQSLPPHERTASLPIDLGTTTTTSMDKAAIRVQRGGAGTCPILVVGVTAATWDGTPFTGGGQDAEQGGQGGS